jgi:hypothetical protein
MCKDGCVGRIAYSPRIANDWKFAEDARRARIEKLPRAAPTGRRVRLSASDPGTAMPKKPRKKQSRSTRRGVSTALLAKSPRSAPSRGAAKTPSVQASKNQVAQGAIGFGSFISTLARADIEVVKPIPITFELEEDGSYIASFLDAGVSSGGETLRDATWSLQEMIAASFQTLRDQPDQQLGPKMRRQRDVLLEFLCPSSRRPTPKTPRGS